MNVDVADEASVKAWAKGLADAVRWGGRPAAPCSHPTAPQPGTLPLPPVTTHNTQHARARVRDQGTKLDVVINNAGVYGPGRQGLDTVDASLMLEVFTTNTVGPLLVVQQLRAHRLLKRPAVVANVTSKVGGAIHTHTAQHSTAQHTHTHNTHNTRAHAHTHPHTHVLPDGEPRRQHLGGVLRVPRQQGRPQHSVQGAAAAHHLTRRGVSATTSHACHLCATRMHMRHTRARARLDAQRK